MVKVNGVNERPLHRVKYTSLLNKGSQDTKVARFIE